MDCLDVHNATSEQRRDISGKEVHILEEGRGGHSNSEYDEPFFFLNVARRNKETGEVNTFLDNVTSVVVGGTGLQNVQ